MNKVVFILVILYFPFVFGQTEEREKSNTAMNKLLYEAQKSIEADDFSSAEATYRKAIGQDPKNVTARYNLGTAYYKKDKNQEAGRQYVEALKNAETKAEKYKLFHNLGNVLMNEKNYGGAVEAYKNALRNNPKDDETRYNLALAKKMLEEEGGGDEDQEDNQQEQENQENQEQSQNQDDQNQGDKDEEQEKQGDEGDNQQQEEQNNEGENQTDEQEQEPEQQQPAEGELSQQQIQSLLEAIDNEDKKAQEKINAEKQKGNPVKPEKDW